MIGYFIALLPLYIFVYTPLSARYSDYLPNLQLLSQSPSYSNTVPLSFNESFIAIEDPEVTGPQAGMCPEHMYKSFILSREPLVIYIKGFLSESESEHLLENGEELYSASRVSTGDESRVNPTIRDSTVATLSRTPTVQCIEARARAFQGFRPYTTLERLKIQKYGVGGHYTHHYDWRGGGKVDRVSSFMVYVSVGDGLLGGGTNFPLLDVFMDERLCEFVECDEDGSGEGDGQGIANGEERKGVTFKPIERNAIYWENLRSDGSGYPETWHAGLPVKNGTKVGLNIWSWYQF